MQKLILWDIDGTLIYSGGVAGEAMRASMERVYGSASTEARHSYAGKTDRQIILETFAERDHDELISTLDHFTATYVEELTRRRDALLGRGRAAQNATRTTIYVRPSRVDAWWCRVPRCPAERGTESGPNPQAVARARRSGSSMMAASRGRASARLVRR